MESDEGRGDKRASRPVDCKWELRGRQGHPEARILGQVGLAAGREGSKVALGFHLHFADSR